MQRIKPTRREFLQTAAVAVGSLMLLPRGLRANEDRHSWFIQTKAGESWAVDDPVSWCLQNSHQPILERAREGLLKLTAEDKDRVIRLVVRRCHLNFIDLRSSQIVVHHWNRLGLTDLRPFFKSHGLARRNVEVVVIDRKRETSTAKTGDDFLFGESLPDDWPAEIYLSKWGRRHQQEPDDCAASPKSCSGFAWDGVESNLIPWAAMKSAWRRTASTCLNCDQPMILANFGQPWIGMFQRKQFVEHVCLKCRRSFEESVGEVEGWLISNLDADVLPQFVMQWDQRAKWDGGTG